ncbi:hypothetical protein BDV59DRAFT_86155 [Aspergillus ambiguus]|uniref:uncharacterized protein n=1 Tax=Aspergillus ambiguus TaxID=176160 RepID=UPI003CCCCFFD
MTEQQPELFRVFVLTAFPRWFGLNRYRVHVPWTVYVADRLGKNPALDGAIYCITSVFLGRSHNDCKLQKSSREMYGKALAAFGGLIKDASQLGSRESVSTSILLSLFESYQRTDQNAWARHASGAALLMSMRGAHAHLTGFDRCLYLSFRSFLVAEAFIHGKPCLFETPAWQDLIDQIRQQDMVDRRATPQISAVIDVSDRLFMEVVKLPGLIHHVRRLTESSSREDMAAMRALEMRVCRCRDAIRGLTRELQISVAAQKAPGQTPAPTPFIGPIPLTFPQEFANGLIRGTDVCFRILDLLHHNLSVIYQETQLLIADVAASPRSTSSLPSSPGTAGSGPAALPSRAVPFRLVSRLQPDRGDGAFRSRGEKLAPVDKWLDLVASSMGMEAFDIVIGHPYPNAESECHSSAAILPLR